MGAASLLVLIFAGIAFAGGGISIALLFVKGSKKFSERRSIRMRYSNQRFSLESISCRLLFICIDLFNF